MGGWARARLERHTADRCGKISGGRVVGPSQGRCRGLPATRDHVRLAVFCGGSCAWTEATDKTDALVGCVAAVVGVMDARSS